MRQDDPILLAVQQRVARIEAGHPSRRANEYAYLQYELQNLTNHARIARDLSLLEAWEAVRDSVYATRKEEHAEWHPDGPWTEDDELFARDYAENMAYERCSGIVHYHQRNMSRKQMDACLKRAREIKRNEESFEKWKRERWAKEAGIGEGNATD